MKKLYSVGWGLRCETDEVFWIGDKKWISFDEILSMLPKIKEELDQEEKFDGDEHYYNHIQIEENDRSIV